MTKVLDLGVEILTGVGSLLEGFKAAAFVGEGTGGFTELEVRLVDEGLFLLELGFEGGGGFREEVCHC